MADINIYSLSKSFNISDDQGPSLLEVLNNISLSVEDGELITIFGPNACGKTTLLKILAGIEKPTNGAEVKIGGKNPSEVRIGYVFQNFSESLFPWLTALENVAFPLHLEGKSKKQSCLETISFIESLGLEIPEESHPYNLSGGQQQMIAILRALNYKPDVFLLDEPFSSLDFQARLEMRDHFLRLWRTSRKTTIFVSHEIDEAIYLCDRMIMLSARPARIAKILKNDLPRPRSRDTLNDPRFLELRKIAIETFTNEVGV